MTRSQPVQARLDEAEQTAFNTIKAYLEASVPAGVKVATSLVVRYALIIAAASIREEQQGIALK
jgi:hypothetical protein